MRALLYTILGLVVAFILGSILAQPHIRNSHATMVLFGWATFLPARLARVTMNWSGVELMLLCLVLVAVLGHSFCSWLWRSGSGAGPWRPKWTAAGLAVVILLFVAGMAVTGVAHQVGWLMTQPSRLVAHPVSVNAYHQLLSIRGAQYEFRYHDRDRNGIYDYWRGDVAGLYGLVVDGRAIQILDLPVAMADDRSRTDLSAFTRGATLPQPCRGYYFRALRFEDESDTALSPHRYAVCAFPSSLSVGNAVFIVSESGSGYVQAFWGKPPEFYPSDPEKAGWFPVED